MNIEEYLKSYEVTQYAIVPSSEIPFSPAVLEACRENRCGRYATCWTCPPGVGEPEEIKAKILSYKTAAIFSCKYDLEDSFDFETMTEGANITQKKLLDIIAKLKSEGVVPHALGCEGCRLCQKCTYPDAPCRFPEKAIPSIEACGVNVVELSKKVGIKYNNGPNTVTYFCAILF
ncbi:MAG: DUF2284 domain-containing protein [Ruminococcaceae bacterium]|nr:DUF2284 domain-containing protein [Oscillospiraceae bacterium]